MFAVTAAPIQSAAASEWWQLALQYGSAPVLVALVSTFALYRQNKQNNEREDRRRAEDTAEREEDREFQRQQAMQERAHNMQQAQAEREHQSDLAKIEQAARSNELEARHAQERFAANAQNVLDRAASWRDERRQAHLRLLPEYQTALKAISKAWDKVTFDETGKALPTEKPLSSFGNEERRRMTDALSDVQMIGSENSRKKATACMDALTHADVAIWVATGGMSDVSTYSRANLQGLINKAKTATTAYIDAIREDLGTAD